MIKLRGPNGTTREITAEEWASCTPLNALANARIAASRVEEKVLMECECCGQEDRISEEAAKKEDTDYWMCEPCAAADDHCLGDPN